MNHVTAGELTISAGAAGVGSAVAPLWVEVSSLSSSTTGNGDQFLGSAWPKWSNVPVIASPGLNAGTGTIRLVGGHLALGGSEQIEDASKLTIDGGATLDIGSHIETVDTLTLIEGSVSGWKGTLTSAKTIQVQSGWVSVSRPAMPYPGPRSPPAVPAADAESSCRSIVPDRSSDSRVPVAKALATPADSANASPVETAVPPAARLRLGRVCRA